MTGKKDFKPRIFYRLSLEKMVPQDHIGRALEEILDMNFIRGLCRKYCSHTGQPSVDPVVLFKMMLIGYLFGITSERKLAEECTVNLAFRWYLGYDLDEVTPNHSVISKARAKFGKRVFEEFFQEVLRICAEKGLVKGEKIFADGILIKANASLKSMTARSDAASPSLSPNEYIEKSLNWLQSPCAKLSVKERACYAEWAIAEPKGLHGLSKTRYRGLEKVTMQGLMTASVQNIKRLLALYRRERLGNAGIIRKIRDIMIFLRPKMNPILKEAS